MAQLQAAGEHCSIGDLILDQAAGTVAFGDPGFGWTWAAWARGYAVEMAAQAAQARGLKSAIISVGGNLRTIGHKPDGSLWAAASKTPGPPRSCSSARRIPISARWSWRICPWSPAAITSAITGGRQALSPPHRPRHPHARRLFSAVAVLGAGFRPCRLPFHRAFLHEACKRARPWWKAWTAWKPWMLADRASSIPPALNNI